jgi:hypothetical protein
MESIFLALVCVPIPFAVTELDGVIHHPWSAFLIPLWTGVAYFIIRRKKIEQAVPTIR